jgi:hypothetical protein
VEFFITKNVGLQQTLSGRSPPAVFGFSSATPGRSRSWHSAKALSSYSEIDNSDLSMVIKAPYKAAFIDILGAGGAAEAGWQRTLRFKVFAAIAILIPRKK